MNARPLRPLARLLAAALPLLTACESSSTNVLGPSAGKCAVAVPARLPAVGASGGALSVNVSVAAECVWQAASEGDWLAITSNPSGQGSGTIQLAAARNPTAFVRRAAILVGGSRVEIEQAGVPCSFVLSRTRATLGPEADEATIEVSAAEGCVWTASSRENWISILNPGSAIGSASVRYRVDANTGATRTGVLTVAGRPFQITQLAAGSPPLPPDPAPGPGPGPGPAPDPPAAPGPDPSPDPDPDPGSDPAPAPAPDPEPAPEPDPDPPPAPCSFAVDPASHAAGANAETVVVAVDTSPGCGWSSDSHASWIRVSGAASGAGPGTVRLAVEANAGASRTGTASVAGRTVTISQAAAACAYSIAPQTQDVALLGGTFSVAVNTGSWCTWSANSNADWIQLIGATNGTGPGTVTYRVPLVSLGLLFSRTGTITISGQTLTVHQRSLLVR
jgi:hypothetical protein